ncbi:hypothetical protein QM155_08510 [Enterobacter hormaechei]|uniref:hypothetical protein n=1 Tax=Enterobacteriaceae TaxID=543 RepID=UPI000C226926|nr:MULTISPECIES: hypothetical protein [Enterobacteriaceae]HBM2592639.1 hypothetical protein [Enterobacter hormaechei subsp. hoffmannii]ATX93818.1 hypothetical protein AM348_20400 [Citrobacter freundii]AVD80205.1 hypothetical protein AM350_22240 [Citrobacter freundii]EHU7375215.1 hypothetical protein [Citrobacter freundii]MDG9956628.1 hypothetical protein [Citrobacter portucalensis]
MSKSVQIRLLINTLCLIKQHKILTDKLYDSAFKSLLSTFYLVMNQKLAVSTINQQSMKKPLTEFLVALREARKDLVLRSINESPQLYSCFFQYEQNENLLTLSFEREYSIFINDNLEKISKYVIDIDNANIQRKLKYIVEELVSFRQSKKTSSLDVFYLNDKIDQIEKLFSVFEKDKDRVEEINYIRRKEQVLFERKFKELSGE